MIMTIPQTEGLSTNAMNRVFDAEANYEGVDRSNLLRQHMGKKLSFHSTQRASNSILSMPSPVSTTWYCPAFT